MWCLCRDVQELRDKIFGDNRAHSEALIAAQQQIAALQASNEDLVTQLGKSEELRRGAVRHEKNLEELANLVHGQRRQLDETEVAVKHIKAQVCRWHSVQCIWHRSLRKIP